MVLGRGKNEYFRHRPNHPTCPKTVSPSSVTTSHSTVFSVRPASRNRTHLPSTDQGNVTLTEIGTGSAATSNGDEDAPGPVAVPSAETRPTEAT